MKLGNPATGADFFGRARELNDLWRYLESDHIRFPGVRRLGKTSILQRLLEQAADHGVLAQWLDVSNVESARELVTRLEDAFPENVIKRFLSDKGQQVVDWLRRIRKIDAKLPAAIGGGGLGLELGDEAAASWKRSADALHRRLCEQPLLILLDEFPVMLQKLLERDRREAEQVLIWLRIWRLAPGHCRFVFTGSIGLQSLLERHGLGEYMNDPFPYPLGPFTPTEARGLWRHFAPISDETPWRVEDPVIDHALGRIGWLSPFFLCLLLDASLRAARERCQESPPGPAGPPRIEIRDVDDAYENLLAERSRFHHWEQRLKEALASEDFAFCSAALTHLSRRPEGLTLGQLSSRLTKHDPEHCARRLQDLLARLTDEGYVSPPDSGKRIQFRSFLLRDWWYRNHV